MQSAARDNLISSATTGVGVGRGECVAIEPVGGKPGQDGEEI